MRELSVSEIGEVSGGRIMDAIPYFTLALGIGTVTFGPYWGIVAVGAAVGSAPLAVGAMTALAVGGGMALMSD